jgi:hypothetical protein
MQIDVETNLTHSVCALELASRRANSSFNFCIDS